MVYLFDRPILPFYNKGKNLSFVVIIFISFFLIKRLRRFHFANLEKDANLVAGESDIRLFQTHYGWWHDTGCYASLHPRLKATRFARAFDLSGRAAVIGGVGIQPERLNAEGFSPRALSRGWSVSVTLGMPGNKEKASERRESSRQKTSVKSVRSVRDKLVCCVICER